MSQLLYEADRHVQSLILTREVSGQLDKRKRVIVPANGERDRNALSKSMCPCLGRREIILA